MNIFNIHTSNRGFIALMSAVIISAIIVGLLFTTGRATFYARFDALDREYKQKARNMAESCINQALLKLAQNYNYDPINEPLSFGDGSCNIISIIPHERKTNSTIITINTSGSYKNSFSNFQVEAKILNPTSVTSIISPNIAINSWREIN